MVTLPFRGESRPRAQPRGAIRLAGGGDVRTVAPAGDPGVNAPAAAFGAASAQALGGVSDDLDSVSLAVAKEGKRRQALKDATFVNEQLIQVERDFSAEFDRRYNEGDPTADDFADQFDAYMQKRVQSIAPAEGVSEDAVARLRAKASGTQLGYFQHASKVGAAERNKKASDVFDGRANVIANRVQRNPDALDSALAEVSDVVDEFGPALTPDGKRDATDRARLKMIEAAVSGRVDRKDFAGAEKLINDQRFDADLSPEAKAQLKVMLKSGKAFERAEVKDLIADHIASIQMTGQGIPDLGARARGLLDEREMRNFRQSERLALGFYGASQRIKFAAPEDMVGVLNEFQPKSGSEDFADRARLWESLRAEARRILAQRNDDPMGYVQNAPEMQGAVAAAGQDGTAAQRMVRSGIAYQGRLGIPPTQQRALSKAQAQGIVADIMGKSPSERAGVLLNLQQQYGAFFPRVMQDLSDKSFNGFGLDPRTMVLASVATTPALSQQLATVLETGSKDLRDGLERDAVSTAEKAVREALAPWMQTVRNGAFGSEREPMLNGIAAAVEDLAISYVRNGEDPSTAAERAANAVINDRFTVQDTYYIPKDGPDGQAYIPANIDSYLSRQKSREALEAAGVVPFGGGANLAPIPKDFTPKERALIDYHRQNLLGGTSLTDEQGTTTIYITGMQGPDGREYLLPGYFDGKRQEPSAVVARADRLGWEIFPSYESVEAAEAATRRLKSVINADNVPSSLDRDRTLRTAVESGYWVTNATGTGAYLMLPFRGGGALPLLRADGSRYEISFREASLKGIPRQPTIEEQASP